MMGKGRLEAFSDGVFAIIITIMVLELKVPHGAELANLLELAPILLSYILSFLYVAIYWNNHHHFFHAVKKVDGRILWANMFLLFWLSLMPFTTGWMGENHFAKWPVVIYGVNLLLCAIAYTWMVRSVLGHADNSHILLAIGGDRKGNISLLCYATAIPLAFYFPLGAGVLFLAVALMWFVPDTRIEKLFR
jgi:uncharacterized membrane protein